MNTNTLEISQQRAARIAGVGYLLIIFLAIFAEFFVRTALIIPGDATATARNIIDNEMQYRLGIVSWIVVVICDIFVAWALYLLFKPVNKSLSLITMLFRLIYIAIKGASLIYFMMALQMILGAESYSAIDEAQRFSQALLYLNAHNSGFLIGLVFFGIHCFLLGCLVYQSSFFPKFLGVLLMLACVGYLIDSFANFIMPNYMDYQSMFLLIVAVPAFIGEVLFCLWLLFKPIAGEAGDNISAYASTTN